MRSAAAWILSLALCVALVACGGGSGKPASPTGATATASGDPGPAHVHGLGVDPADGALLIATHSGLFRAAAGERTPVRVGDRFQDTMGFAVLGPRHYIGSGHPDPRDDLPPFLGLIESRDGGRNWMSIALLGKRDFHLLAAAGQRVYGYGSDYQRGTAGLLASSDGGVRWQRRRAPGPLVSLAVDPHEPKRLVASTSQGLLASRDAGRSWVVLGRPTGLVAFVAGKGPLSARLLVVDGAGRSWRTQSRRWTAVGEIGGPPAALGRGAPGEMLVALHDGTVMRSTDGGRSWTTRAVPS